MFFFVSCELCVDRVHFFLVDEFLTFHRGHFVFKILCYSLELGFRNFLHPIFSFSLSFCVFFSFFFLLLVVGSESFFCFLLFLSVSLFCFFFPSLFLSFFFFSSEASSSFSLLFFGLPLLSSIIIICNSSSRASVLPSSRSFCFILFLPFSPQFLLVLLLCHFVSFLPPSVGLLSILVVALFVFWRLCCHRRLHRFSVSLLSDRCRFPSLSDPLLCISAVVSVVPASSRCRSGQADVLPFQPPLTTATLRCSIRQPLLSHFGCSGLSILRCLSPFSLIRPVVRRQSVQLLSGCFSRLLFDRRLSGRRRRYMSAVPVHLCTALSSHLSGCLVQVWLCLLFFWLYRVLPVSFSSVFAVLRC